MASFQKELEVRWSDCDPNRHLRSSALADYATHVRFSYLDSRGFPVERFGVVGIGPVVQLDETTYFREVRTSHRLTIDLKLAGLSPDGARWWLRHECIRSDGVLAARQIVRGGWISLERRQLAVPPVELAEAFRALEHTDDFEDLRALTPRPLRANPQESSASLQAHGATLLQGHGARETD